MLHEALRFEGKGRYVVVGYQPAVTCLGGWASWRGAGCIQAGRTQRVNDEALFTSVSERPQRLSPKT